MDPDCPFPVMMAGLLGSLAGYGKKKWWQYGSLATLTKRLFVLARATYTPLMPCVRLRGKAQNIPILSATWSRVRFWRVITGDILCGFASKITKGIILLSTG